MLSAEKICTSSAGPFRNIHNDNISGGLLFLFTISSALITARVRRLVLGYCFSPLPLSKPVQPTTTQCLHCQHCQHANALESESKAALEALVAEAESRKARRPSITHFAICTTLSIINIIVIVLLAFSIQSTVYCAVHSNATPHDSGQDLLGAILTWIFFFAISVAWASSGILCWAMWVRNLWGGPEAAERWPIQHNIGPMILAGVFSSPFVLVLLVFLGLVILVGSVAQGVGKGVSRCWCWCKRPLKEEEAIEAERVVGYDSGNVTEENDGGEK